MICPLSAILYIPQNSLQEGREAATKTKNKTWDPGGSTISQVNSHVCFLVATVEIGGLNNTEDSDNDATS